MDVENLDFLIKTRFTEILDDIRPDKKKLIHPKSVRNIIYHLIDKPQKIKKSKSYIVKEDKIKRKLLAYFKEIQATDLDPENSKKIWDEYLKEVCEFMTSYYDFALKKGCCGAIIFSLIGLVIDVVLINKDVTSFPFFTMLFFISVFVENSIRIKQKRIYGIFY